MPSSFFYFLFLLVIWVSLPGCNKNAYVMQSVKTTDDKTNVINQLQPEFFKGIDFIATGNIPENWKLEMDYEGEFSFSTATEKFKLLARKPMVDAHLTTYFLKDKTGSLTVYISDTICKGNSSLMTSIDYKSILYKGCGQHLYDSRLINKWEIFRARDTLLKATDFNGKLPEIVVDPVGLKLTITSNCVSIDCPIFVSGDKLIVGNALVKSSGRCTNNSLKQIITDKLLNHISTYFFKNGHLYIYLVDDSVLVCREK